eukprot:g8040.t2
MCTGVEMSTWQLADYMPHLHTVDRSSMEWQEHSKVRPKRGGANTSDQGGIVISTTKRALGTWYGTVQEAMTLQADVRWLNDHHEVIADRDAGVVQDTSTVDVGHPNGDGDGGPSFANKEEVAEVMLSLAKSAPRARQQQPKSGDCAPSATTPRQSSQPEGNPSVGGGGPSTSDVQGAGGVKEDDGEPGTGGRGTRRLEGCTFGTGGSSFEGVFPRAESTDLRGGMPGMTITTTRGRGRHCQKAVACMKQEFMAAENSPVECLSRAKSLVNHWRREHGPDEGKALADAREAYLKCIAVIDSSEDDLNVRAQVGLAKLELVAGDPASTRSGLARLSEALRDHPYSNSIEDVIYLLAIQAAFPSTGQTSAAATGALEYLDYLRESYAPAHEGAPTASLYPHWDSNEDVEGERKQDPSLACAADNWGGQGLHVNGLPAWALQFQIGLLASRMGNSTRGMETMENAFTSYEAWLPRSLGGFNDDIPDVDAIRRCWYHGLAHWTDWVQHPRTWLDMGDISYRQGPGYFHVAAEAYRGALQRAGDVFRPDQQEAIAYRIAKCCSRYGDITGAIAGIEQLLYTRNFWSERYRNHLKAWSEAWREHFLQEDMASLRLQCFWRMTAAKMELHFLRAQDRLVQEYTELKRRNVLKHRFRSILEYCREKKRLSKFATDIQCMYRVRNARTIASTLRAVRDFKEAIVQAHVSKLIRNFQVLCFKHWVQHHGLVRLDKAATKIQGQESSSAGSVHADCAEIARRERAATTIQAMARGVVGRELASDERNRQARIQELLLKALERLGMPVLREWYKAAHDMRKARMATKIQARWRTFRARRKWTITKTKVSRARAMGIEAIGRHRHADQRRVFERWKHVVLVRKVVTVQRKARMWLAKRITSKKRRRKKDLDRLFTRVTKPVRRQCFVALVRNRNACRKDKGNKAIVIQCWWRCRLAVTGTQKIREYRGRIQKAFDTVASNHDRRLLVHCCQEWRENIPKMKAAAQIQAAWRGWQGRLRAAWFRDRQARFEVAVGVLRAVYQRRVREYAFEEWRTPFVE